MEDERGVGLFLRRDDEYFAPEVLADDLDDVARHRLVHRERRAEHEQTLDDVVRRHVKSVGELADGDALGDGDGVAADRQLDVVAATWCGGFLDLRADGLLVLLLLATTLDRGGGNGGLGLFDDLGALQLFGLHGHLAVAVLFFLVAARPRLRPRGARALRR